MPYPKQKPEYFLKRIKEFHDKNNRAPRSDEFNGPFYQNVNNYFGSWAAAVRQATGVELNCARKTDEQLLAPIKKYFDEHKKIMRMENTTCKNTLIIRFGSFNGAVKAATGIDIDLSVLRAINGEMVNGVDCVTLTEIQSALNRTVLMNNPQLKGVIQRCVTSGWIESRRGDRIVLYSITKAGKAKITEGEKSNGNRVR